MSVLARFNKSKLWREKGARIPLKNHGRNSEFLEGNGRLLEIRLYAREIRGYVMMVELKKSQLICVFFLYLVIICCSFVCVEEVANICVYYHPGNKHLYISSYFRSIRVKTL